MLTDREFMRYNRQLSLDDIGESGQLNLKQSHVLIVGCGGLGSSAALFLAASGVGRLVVADGDDVDSSNLQRQIVFREVDQDSNKATAMAEQLTQLNNYVSVRAIPKHLDGMQLQMEISLADVVLDCTDNIETRHAINSACFNTKTPLISGSAIGWQGQLACFDYQQDTPCYRCLYAFEHMAAGTKCSDAGIMGPVVGIIGNYQALQAIKFISKQDRSQFGKLFLFDAQYLDWRSLNLSRDPSCSVCGGEHETTL
jgi:sulfur carrier protein ThiS adenylyltransferase